MLIPPRALAPAVQPADWLGPTAFYSTSGSRAHTRVKSSLPGAGRVSFFDNKPLEWYQMPVEDILHLDVCVQLEFVLPCVCIREPGPKSVHVCPGLSIRPASSSQH